MQRNYKDPEYRKWRKAVFKRDKHRCKWCGRNRKLQAHHILRWSEWPNLRFEISNGITLCKYCHSKIWGREDQYAVFLTNLLGDISDKHYLRIMRLKYGAP